MTGKRNLVTLLGIAFVVAVIATGLFYGLVVNKLESTVARARDTVVVASRDLVPGQVLAAGDVKLAPRTEVDPLVEGFAAAEAVRGLVVMAPVKEGQPLVREELAAKDSALGAALGIPAGLRAVSVHVTDSTGVVRLLRPGNRVDTQLVTRTRSRGVVLRTLLQDIEVLRVEGEPEASEGRPVLPVVTLLATPEEADALAIADAAARLRLVLRHPLDDRLTKRGSVILAAVLKNPPQQKNREAGVSNSSAPSKATTGKAVETASVTKPAPGR